MNNKLTELTLFINGTFRGYLVYPIIDNIKSIEYRYDTHLKRTRVDLTCDSKIRNLDRLVESVISNIPEDSEEILVSVKCTEVSPARQYH